MSEITTCWDTSSSGGLVIANAPDFRDMRSAVATRLLKQTPFNSGKWQQIDISQSSAHDTYEILNLSMWYEMPVTRDEAEDFIRPDMPWSEAHFRERVSGIAMNPGVEHENWPHHAGKVELHQHGGKYDHNYMERMAATQLRFDKSHFPPIEGLKYTGYRFPVGDLLDVIRQLGNDPGTRQAYLPIFFPEDTGATQGQRVPCTLGYHFIIREGVLHMTYNMRSCEVYRHFTNDVYMAVRLAHHVRDKLRLHHGVVTQVGQLTMNVTSFHGFVGDAEKIGAFQNDR